MQVCFLNTGGKKEFKRQEYFRKQWYNSIIDKEKHIYFWTYFWKYFSQLSISEAHL